MIVASVTLHFHDQIASLDARLFRKATIVAILDPQRPSLCLSLYQGEAINPAARFEQAFWSKELST